LGPSWGTYEITGHEVQLPPEAFYAALDTIEQGEGLVEQNPPVADEEA
jgi:hypothetical protein